MKRFPVAATLLALSGDALGQYNGYGGYGGGSNGGFGGSSSGSSSSNGGFGNFGSNFLGFDIQQAMTYRIVHGVLASLAFVFFFPVGAICMRILPGKAAIVVHTLCQLLAYVIYIAAFALGIWMARTIRFQGLNFFNQHHPIIGIVVFVLLFFQPILGIIHHKMFKKYGRRQFWSYAHLWLGRILITLGIINGGLGLQLANNTRSGEIAYGVVAGFFWLLWMSIALWSEAKRARNASAQAPAYKEPNFTPRFHHSNGRKIERGNGFYA